MKITFYGLEPEASLSLGGQSMTVRNGEPIELDDELARRVLESNPNFKETEPKPTKKEKSKD
jgi:hypothetical protein